MPKIQGVKGDAVVCYREPLTTQEMRYHRLSRRVNNRATITCWQHLTVFRRIRKGFITYETSCRNWLFRFRRVVYATSGL